MHFFEEIVHFFEKYAFYCLNRGKLSELGRCGGWLFELRKARITRGWLSESRITRITRITRN